MMDDTLQQTKHCRHCQTLYGWCNPGPWAEPAPPDTPGGGWRAGGHLEIPLFRSLAHLHSLSPRRPGAPATVAYRLQACSRLEVSPKEGSGGAYHTMPGKAHSNTKIIRPGKFLVTARGARVVQSATGSKGGRTRPGAGHSGTAVSSLIESMERTWLMSNPTASPYSSASSASREPAQASGRVAAQPSPEACGTLSTTPPLIPPQEEATAPAAADRCSVKGCVFPASQPATPRCRYHEHLHSEGQLFQSHQPSYLLTLRAPYGIPADEPEDSREHDRRRQAMEREEFLLSESE